MQTQTWLTLSKVVVAVALLTAGYFTLCALGALMGDRNPRMTPAEVAADQQAKQFTLTEFQGAWLFVAASFVGYVWQKQRWKAENAAV